VALSDDLSVTYIGLSQEQRGLGRLKLALR